MMILMELSYFASGIDIAKVPYYREHKYDPDLSAYHAKLFDHSVRTIFTILRLRLSIY